MFPVFQENEFVCRIRVAACCRRFIPAVTVIAECNFYGSKKLFFAEWLYDVSMWLYFFRAVNGCQVAVGSEKNKWELVEEVYFFGYIYPIFFSRKVYIEQKNVRLICFQQLQRFAITRGWTAIFITEIVE